MKTGILMSAVALAAAASAQAVVQSEPARDKRGIPVVSNPATPPPGANEPPGTQPRDPQQVFAPRPSAGDYPICSREITDGCKQPNERERSPN